MTDDAATSGYRYRNALPSHAHAILLPAVRRELKALQNALPQPRRRVFDLGCGNGSVGAVLYGDGWDVSGVDPSVEGIVAARSAYPFVKVDTGSAYEDLVARFGRYPVVISLEVVEHVYAPRLWARSLFDLLEPGGTAIVFTPYHGYWKNVALAVTGKMDRHFTALWDHGHIKFWSMATLTQLLEEAGFSAPRFIRVGRVPPLAKSMLAVVTRPQTS